MRRLPLLLTCLAPFSALTVAHAVVVSGGDGTQNATAPSDDFGFANVGQVYNTENGFFNSGVYLGNGWVLTAYHVVRNDAGGFLFGDVIFHDPILGNVTFNANPATAVRLQNADSSFADLALFQLTAIPTFLSPVSIASSLPTSDKTVVMAGNGVNRETGLTQWNVTTSNGGVSYSWVETPVGGNASGYKEIEGSQTVRWGTNNIETGTGVDDFGFGSLTYFTTDFDNTNGQAQGAAGDSGGGVFYKNGSTWELVGILDATGAYNNQPNFTAVYGDETYAASLPTYRNQIVNTIPEPGVTGLGIVGAALLGSFRRRRKA